VWDADDSILGHLRWPTVRVLRYRQPPAGWVRGGGRDWLTDFPRRQVSARSLYLLAKSRWEVRTRGSTTEGARYGLEHIRHHHAASLFSVGSSSRWG